MELLQLSYEFDRLNDLIDDRNRLLRLHLKISQKDNNTILKQLENIHNLCLKLKDIDQCTKFNNILKDLLDLQTDHLQIDLDTSTPDVIDHNNKDPIKRVRFMDNPVVPFQDDPKDSSNYSTHDSGINTTVTTSRDQNDHNNDNLTNEDIFNLQKQQLIDQDVQLSSLHQNIRNQNSISNEINNEVVNQNTFLLNDLESQLDTTTILQNRAQTRLNKYNKLSQSIDNFGRCKTITILIVILLLLIII